MAAMINDVLYSKEQKTLHHFEGFGDKVTQPTTGAVLPDLSALGVRSDTVANAATDVVAIRDALST